MAENGYECTPAQARELLKSALDVFESVDYTNYMLYKAFDEQDIHRMAEATGITYEHAKDVVDIVLFVGRFKYGE